MARIVSLTVSETVSGLFIGHLAYSKTTPQSGLDHGVGHPIRLWPGTSTSALEDRGVGGRRRHTEWPPR
jgi:hypothetical protein